MVPLLFCVTRTLGQGGGLLFPQGPSKCPIKHAHQRWPWGLRLAETGGPTSYHPIIFHITRQLRILDHMQERARLHFLRINLNLSPHGQPSGLERTEPRR